MSQSFRHGFTLEFNDREDGYRGIQKQYGLTFDSVQSMEPALRYQAIQSKDVDVIDAYSIDSERCQQYDLVVLEDDRMYSCQSLSRSRIDGKMRFAAEHPQVVKALEKTIRKKSQRTR